MMCSSSAGTCGFEPVGDVGVWFRIASKTSAEVRPENGSFPVAISYSTTPNENRSERSSISSPRACSGDMYDSVPSACPVSVAGAGALAVNFYCAYVLAPFRAHGGSLARAAYLSARNDAAANLAIVAAGQTGGNAVLKNPAALKDKAPETFKADFEVSNGKHFVIEVHRAWSPNG